MKNLRSSLLATVFLLLAAAAAMAQPANNNFASRFTLSGSRLATNGTTVGANREGNDPAPFNSFTSPTVWYEWVAPASSSTTIAISGSYREVIGAYTGNELGALTEAGSATAGNGGTTASFTFTPTSGTSYKILVGGRQGQSGTFTLTITQAVFATITAPANNSSVVAGTPVVITATAEVANPPVARLDFYRNGALLGADTTSTYAFTNTPPLGTSVYTAVAVDNNSLSITSSPVTVNVVNPGVFITAPADNAAFLNNNPITVTAVGVVASGSVTNINFFVDGQQFASDASSPFSVSWGGVTPGSHLFSAVGRDTSGINYTSAPVGISVARILMTSNSVWKFLDTGVDQGTAWVAPGFNDTSWLSGPAELGYGDSGDNPPRPEATMISFGPDPNNKYPTAYFRRAFTVTDAASYTNMVIRIMRDDGAVVYINGIEASRFNMPGGVIAYDTLAPNAGDDGNGFVSGTPITSLLVEGTNTLAVEMHQSGTQGQPVTSTDMSFDLELLGIPVILRNQPPAVAVTSPADNASLLAPASVTVTADATDTEGTVTNVQFHLVDLANNDSILGIDTTAPYQATWNSPTQGWYQVYAIATDNEGATGFSAGNFVTVYDAIGTPRVQIFNPTNGATYNGPTNVDLFAGTTSPNGVTNVEFRANGAFIGRVVFPSPTSPANVPFTWTNAAYGTSAVTAVSFDASGLRGTSAPISIVVIAPPPNLAAPLVLGQNPPADATLTNLTSIQILFTEFVTGVNASDLLINGTPAAGVSGSGSNYTFTLPQPGAGTVNITWNTGHGIQDLGLPPLPFDASEVGQSWSYTIIDGIPPAIVTRVPAAGATITNLTQIAVTFSESVQGVDAADLLINGSPAIGLDGSGAGPYTFSFSQPAAGTVNLSWLGGHGITDLASPPNAFNGAAATWSYTLDLRSILVQSNANWLFIKGLANASSPPDLWRGLLFNDGIWSNAPAPFFYGDPYSNGLSGFTLLSDMPNNAYSSIYMRRKFVVAGAAGITNLFLNAQSDDGFIAWINGVEVVRYNMPAGDVPYNGSATAAAPNDNNGVPYILYTLADPGSYLVEGTNVLAIHAFNVISTPASSDFGFNAQLYTFIADPGVVPPRLFTVVPSAGDVLYLTNITVAFTEPVSGVNAGDLRVNGVAATLVTSTTNSTYTFHFTQPAFGQVSVTWTVGHGIQDLDAPPKPFDATAGGSTFGYTLINPSAPTVASQSPLGGGSVTSLTQVVVNFSEAVTGVEAADLRVNGVPATNVSGGPVNYTFTFPQPPYGAVALGWSLTSNISDLENPANDFDPTRSGNTWSYTLVDQIPPVVASKNPPAGSLVTNLTQLTVTFSEAVSGVGAGDLLINGTPATAVSGSGAGPYTFTFAQPNATVVNVSWIPAHGITDQVPQGATPNAFNATGTGATWSYSTPDTLAPALATISPAPFVTVKTLTQISVTFTEPVTGVDTNDLLMNGVRARQLTGGGAGPYTFTWLPPAAGPVEVRWTPTHNITDLALPQPNAFPGGEWTYIYDPNATFAGKVLINEIMFDPADGSRTNEWIELRNVSTNAINLAGWRFTKGVSHTFPNRTLATNGYLVVAADLAAFQQNYPGVTNVIGGWTGSLANSDENLELQTALGETVNAIHYASEGDWARRERGQSADPVTGLTRSGSTATVTLFGHGYTANDQVILSGADQPEYNGRFLVVAAGTSTFTITVPGTPATPATGSIICRRVLDDNFGGWYWFSAAAGFGCTLELVNPVLPNTSGQNWLTSTNLGGTPGRANSTATNNVAPLIENVVHFPPVPRPTDNVAITARLTDELGNGIASAQLFYRNHTTTSPNGFLSTNLFDDGMHSDGLGGDKLYGAILPAAGNGTIIEFYVQATDTGGRVRTWPAPAVDTNGVPGQLANALYQVDNETVTNTMPVIRAVMTASERAGFPPGNRQSDSAVNLTLISTGGDGVQIRHLGDARIRGAGSRTRTPPNNRISIPNDNRWNGRSAFNLNSQFVHAQAIGNVLAAKAGLPNEEGYVVQYRINGVNPAPISAPQNGSGNGAGWGVFLLLKPTNGDLLDELYPENAGGNVYRASTGNHNADLSYRGTIPDSYLARGYTKNSNRSENDWTDLMQMTTAFSFTGSETDYAQSIRTNVNVELWMRYFALGSLMNFGETSMFNGRGDDYGLYRGLNDPRFIILPHDFDTIFGQGDGVDQPPDTGYYPIRTNASIYIMINPPNGNANVPLLRPFMTNAAFAPVFFAELKRLCDGVFHPSQLRPLMDQHVGTNLWGVGPDGGTVAAMKDYAESRRQNVLAQIPLALTINSALPVQNGYLSTATPGVTIFGTAHAIDTRGVLVNGTQARWAAWDARWTNSITLQPGLNRVLVQSLDSNNVEFARATLDIWYDDGTVQNVSGAIAADTTWTAANGPYNVTGSVTVNSGVTLTIQAGTTLYLGAGVNLTVANGGRLLAEGTETASIRFSRAPGAATSWGGITVNGGAGSPETRIAHAHFEFNGSTAIHSTAGTVFLDHLTFGNTAVQYVSLDGSSFVVQDCVFPATTAGFEPVHGSGGIKAGGRGIVRRNFWGRITGYNDAFDFSGGNRPGPILQVINNVFVGSDDDLLDLDSTDAWIEGNIFLHVHRNGSPDSASAVSGGSDNASNSEITMVGNLFYDVDQAANAKQTNFYTMVNNTIVRQNRVGSQDTNAAVVILADDGTSQGAGIYLEGNIIYDAENLTRNVTTALVTYTNNLIRLLQGAAWSGPGGNNPTNDPLLTYIPQLSETTNFNSWAQAQVLKSWFSLRAGSPASGTGPNGRDKGGVVPFGASISGEPSGITPLATATLRVGALRTGSGIPVNGFPNGSGYTHYKWRLDGGPWSAETPAATPIALAGLSGGQHYVEVSGRNDAGFYQDDPVFGADATVTRSRTWSVQPLASPLRLNEILASNTGASNHFGTTPDLIELWNSGDTTVDLSGVGLTDDPGNPAKFLFPNGTMLAAGAYLTVFANNVDGTPGTHLGFGLSQTGDEIFLYDASGNGGALIDSISFGPQLNNLSIGRLSDGAWALCQPTFSGLNRAAPLGDPRNLRLNEWLALAQTPFNSDFVELYNSDPLPVALGGLFFSDEIVGLPNRHAVVPLSFIAGNGYLRYLADGDRGAGGDHLNFKLSSEQGGIGLYEFGIRNSEFGIPQSAFPILHLIDCVVYGPQRPNVSQGRSPNGSTAIVFFDTPTPGAPNPLVIGPAPGGGALVINEVLAANASLAEGGRTPDWIELYNGTTNSLSLADRSLTDNTLLPRKFVFAPGTVLAAGAYLRVICDPGSTNPGALTATNFALSGTGGGVYLFDTLAGGGGLLNSILYGLQVPDLSIGRVPDGSTNWVLTSPTAGSANAAVPALGDPAVLRVNEWLANPPPGDDDWFELFNPGLLPVSLGHLYLTDDLNNRTKHKIAALSFIGFGTNGFIQFHADGNTGAGADHTSFSLSASFEGVGFSATNGTLLNGILFTNQVEGVSEGRFPDGAAVIVAFPGTDSPGAPNYRQLATVAINEVLSHTDEPLEDAIELRNLTGGSLDVSGWWLSDDNGTLQKYQLPFGTILPPHGFTVVYETHFTNATEAAVPFALSSGGDEVVLSATSGGVLNGFRRSVKFGAAANGVSFGRYLTSDAREEFVAMSERTFGVDDPGSVIDFRTGAGKTNVYPVVGPVLISEIMYHPPDDGTNDNTLDEFIEIKNVGTISVPLYDPAAPTNTWRLRDAVDFDFPTGILLPAGATLLVVGFDPINNPGALTAFRAHYNLDAGQAITGPWSGKLANDHDDIELRRPDAPNTNGVPSILVERVHYYDNLPWDALADGTGYSLQRVSETGFGNDPTNYFAGTPTPGPQAGSLDTDGDGMPNAWEYEHNFDPFNPNDAALDTDGDGLTNLQEYQLGTDPRNAQSALSITSVALSGGDIVLTFNAASNIMYNIDYTDALGGAWFLYEPISTAPTNRVIIRVIPASLPQRFFRLRL